MIDTHAHLDFPAFSDDREAVIESCHNNGVNLMVNIGVDLETSKASIALAEKYDYIYAAVGYHPHDSKDLTDDIFDKIAELAKHPKVVAIGEIGLDFYRDLSPRDIQKKVFIRQLDLAEKLNLPVILHIRQALDETFDILHKRDINRGILHAFPGNKNEALEGVKMGYYVAFGGPITYPKSNRPEVAVAVPRSRILTETDCPYLPPQQFRGKRNQPDYIKYVIEKLTEVFPRYSYHDIERITELNASRALNLPLNDPVKIVYRIGRSIYINLTMRCTNNCYFCPKNSGHHVAGHNLLLNHEPTEKEILSAIENHHDYDEIVFCGLGEPSLRANLMLSLADTLKSKQVPIRLDTNGQGNVINKTDLAAKMVGLIDSVNVSLNAQDESTYAEICRPQYGGKVYEDVIKFARLCKGHGIETVFSVVDVPEIDVKKCREIAQKEDIPLRVRHYAPL